MFGLWDPEKAVPLEWSSGHEWTAELVRQGNAPVAFGTKR